PLIPIASPAVRTSLGSRVYLQDFAEIYGALLAKDLKPLHVARWLDAHPGWKGSRRNAVVAVKRAFNWADAEGVLQPNPVKAVKKPPQNRRDRVLSQEEREQILGAIKDRHFREFVFAMMETGARPGEVRKVTAAHGHLDVGGAQDGQAHRDAPDHLPDAGDGGAEPQARGDVPGGAALPRPAEQARLHPQRRALPLPEPPCQAAAACRGDLVHGAPFV